MASDTKYKYWIGTHPTLDNFSITVYTEADAESLFSKGYSVVSHHTEGPLIRLWTVTADHGDGSSSSKIFTTEKEATEWAENDEYFPEVNSVVIDASLFEKVGLPV